MMRYNFRPNLSDHCHVLILVRPFFNTSDQDFNFVLRKLAQFSCGQLKDSDQRMLLKFTKGYSREMLEWGRLQMHRRPLGFVGVARLSNDRTQHVKDYEKIEHRFQGLINQYNTYLYDSRCVIIGPENPNVTISDKNMFYVPLTDKGISEELQHFVCGFISSIYVVLESKRVDKTNENSERMVLPTAPNEKEATNSDSDTRIIRRKSIGRNKKILGDLCLLAGLYEDSLMNYSLSLDHLRNVNDHLWVGSTLEGLCAVSNAMMLGDSMINPEKIILTIDGSNINANVDVKETKVPCNYSPLTLDLIISKYSECLACYKRFVTGPVEIDAHFKFIRILLKLKKKVELAQIVQSLLVLPLSFNDNEKIDFSNVLASIHEQLGMFRKASFYRWRAALYYMDSTSANSSLPQAMVLLKKVCPAYQIDMEHNTAASRDKCKGWPTVQLSVLLDMLRMSRSLGNHLDSVRLICYILETHGDVIGSKVQTELIDWLEEYSDEKEPLQNQTKSEMEIQLIHPLPIIKDFRPKKLAYHLQPLKWEGPSKSNTPFIFSSLSTRHKPKVDENVVWVCDDVSEVVMLVDNPLPAEIKVNNMTLITEGIPFEAHPATLALPGQSGFFPFMLLGTPKESGELVIKGYKVDVLGITNVVQLPKPIKVEVTPLLPALKLSSTLPRAPNTSSLDPENENYQTLFTSANVYEGHSCSGKITLENSGKVPITRLNLKVKESQETQLQFNITQVTDQLPLLPNDSLHFDVVIMPNEAWKRYKKNAKVEPSLSMTYSCEEGEAGGCARRITWVTFVKVMPSLVLFDFDVFEIERHPSCCLICCNAINMTSIYMNLECTLNNPKENTDVPDCCAGPYNLELASKKKVRVEIHYPRILLPCSKYVMETLENVYQKFIAESVCLHWRLADTNYSGVTYLQALQVKPEMMQKLKPSKLHMVIRVNDELVGESQVIHARAGMIINITVTLKNSHISSLENQQLKVRPYQEVFRTPEFLEELYLPSGCLCRGIRKLEPEETYTHVCGLLFLYCGTFLVDVSCEPSKRFGTHVSNEQKRLSMLPPDEVDKIPTPNKKRNRPEIDTWVQTVRINVT